MSDNEDALQRRPGVSEVGDCITEGTMAMLRENQILLQRTTERKADVILSI